MEPQGAFESIVEQFGPPAAGTTRTILVGVDGTATAMRAASFAFGMARRQNCRLLVTFVAARSALSGLGPSVAVTAEAEALLRLYTDLRDEMRADAEELGVPVTFMKVHGDPYTTLREAADTHQVDVVVVGASTSAGHRIAGSVATRLIRAGHWPVLVVP
jgi:nucleotide-binding universal stress UspA family protein